VGLKGRYYREAAAAIQGAAARRGPRATHDVVSELPVVRCFCSCLTVVV